MKSAILLVMGLVLGFAAQAQQAGTPQYNSVYLPAHGVGDTRAPRAVANAWGAFAQDPSEGWIGKSLNASSKEDAEAAALLECRTRGGKACALALVFNNQCAAIVTDGSLAGFASSRTARAARSAAKDACRPGVCNEIFFEGCSLGR